MDASAEKDIEQIPAPWGGHIEPEDLNVEKWTEDLREMADRIGVAHTMALCERFGGCAVYFPRLENLLRSARDAAIRRLSNGANTKQLSRKFALTVRQIYDVLGRK